MLASFFLFLSISLSLGTRCSLSAKAGAARSCRDPIRAKLPTSIAAAGGLQMFPAADRTRKACKLASRIADGDVLAAEEILSQGLLITEEAHLGHIADSTGSSEEEEHHVLGEARKTSTLPPTTAQPDHFGRRSGRVRRTRARHRREQNGGEVTREAQASRS